MLKFKEVTSNGYTNLEATFQATLVSVSDTAIVRNNDRGTSFYPCTISLPNGKEVSAAIEAANLEKYPDRYMLGKTNTVTARKTGDQIFLTVAPFSGVSRVTLDDLEDAFGEVEEENVGIANIVNG
jgi:hypothetical protein